MFDLWWVLEGSPMNLTRTSDGSLLGIFFNAVDLMTNHLKVFSSCSDENSCLERHFEEWSISTKDHVPTFDGQRTTAKSLQRIRSTRTGKLGVNFINILRKLFRQHFSSYMYIGKAAQMMFVQKMRVYIVDEIDGRSCFTQVFFIALNFWSTVNAAFCNHWLMLSAA